MQSITATYVPDAALIRAASLSWPPEPGVWQAALGGAIFGIVAILLVRFGLNFNPDGSHFVAALIGAGVVLTLWQLQHMRIMRFITSAALSDTPSITATFDALGVRLQTQTSDSHLKWPAVSAIIAIKGGTGLRVGATAIGIPDTAIMEQMTPVLFRDRLTKWREAAT